MGISLYAQACSMLPINLSQCFFGLLENNSQLCTHEFEHGIKTALTTKQKQCETDTSSTLHNIIEQKIKF